MAMQCEPCGKSFSGLVSYNQHIESEKHKRKMSMIEFQNRSAEKQNTIGNFTDVPRKIPCDICNVFLDSVEHFTSHTMTLEHAKNVSKRYENNTANDPSLYTVSSSTSSDTAASSYSNKNTVLPSHDETGSILPPVPRFAASPFAPFTECKTCNKQFSGLEPYKQHLVSAGHTKKVEMEKFLSGAGTNQNILNRFSCEPCKKVFSGQVPLEQHLVSEIHKKKVQNIQLLEQVKRNKEIQNTASMTECDSPAVSNVKTCISDDLQDMDMDQPWFCKICLVQCSGLIPYQQHINGETHWKNKRKIGMAKHYTEAECIKSGDVSLEIVNTSVANNAVPSNTVLFPESDKISQILIPRPVSLSEVSGSHQDIESDILLPQTMQNLLISADEINLKEFLPDEKIDFDNSYSIPEDNVGRKIDVNNTENSEDRTGEVNSTQETLKETIINKEKIEVYEECKLCNVQLKSKEDFVSHLESLEHFKRRWSSNE